MLGDHYIKYGASNRPRSGLEFWNFQEILSRPTRLEKKKLENNKNSQISGVFTSRWVMEKQL